MSEFDSLTTDAVLQAAWKALRTHKEDDKLLPFPRGFWPDVARVAVEMMRQKTLDPELDFLPTMSGNNVSLLRGRKQRLPMQKMMTVEIEDDDNPFNWASKG